MKIETRKKQKVTASKSRKTMDKSEKMGTYCQKIDEVENEIVEKMEQRERLLSVLATFRILFHCSEAVANALR